MELSNRYLENPAGWSAFDQLDSLRREMNRFFESPIEAMPRTLEFFNGWVPVVDLLEDPEKFTVRVELPGMDKDKIDICLHEGALTISGERRIANEDKEVRLYRSERAYGRFHRVLSLPKAVEGDKVKANYKDGILEVALPKVEEVKPRQIEINAS